MGINISVVNKTSPHIAKPWFDPVRHVGDREFIISKEIEWLFEPGDDDLMRPKDIEKAEAWVKANIIDCNQNRLLHALSKMRTDKNLYFDVGW